MVVCNLDLKNSSNQDRGNILKGNDIFLHDFGPSNIFLGKNSGNFNQTGQKNIGIGDETLRSIESGSENNAIGFRSQFHATTGEKNTTAGSFSGEDIVNGSNNAAVGANTLRRTSIGEPLVGPFIEKNAVLGVGALGNIDFYKGGQGSSKRYKENITSLHSLNNKVERLFP
jgi:hypothetical protein